MLCVGHICRGSYDGEVGALQKFGGRQDAVIAGSVAGRCDWMDDALEWPHRAAMKAEETMLKQWRLNGQCRLIDDRQPSPGRRADDIFQRVPGSGPRLSQTWSAGIAR